MGKINITKTSKYCEDTEVHFKKMYVSKPSWYWEINSKTNYVLALIILSVFISS
jgi:hypothetical protein